MLKQAILIASMIDINLKSLIVLIDLSTDFDTLNHTLIFKSLEKICIFHVLLKLFILFWVIVHILLSKSLYFWSPNTTLCHSSSIYSWTINNYYIHWCFDQFYSHDLKYHMYIVNIQIYISEYAHSILLTTILLIIY